MTITYLDTSALMRLMTREGDVGPIERAMRSGPITSVLATVELRAAISRRWHDRHLSDQQRDALLALAGSEIVPALTLLPLSDEVIAEARNIVDAHTVRTLDALHVATAVIAGRRAKRRGVSLYFCTADRRQADVCTALLPDERVLFVPPWQSPPPG